MIDIGSNKGQFTLLVNNLLPKVPIIAFEPQRSESRIFKKIFKKNNTIILKEFALGSSNKKMKMNLASSRDSSSLLKMNLIQKDLWGIFNTDKVEEIQLKRMDDFLGLISQYKNIFLKIDVQGYELEVLRGSSETLNYIKYIYLEASNLELYKDQALFKDIKEFLNLKNFELLKTSNKDWKNNNEWIQADFLFINKEKSIR